MAKDAKAEQEVKTKTAEKDPIPLFMGDQVHVEADTTTNIAKSDKQKAYQKIDPLLRRWITSENTIVLAGAGASVGEDKSGGKSMAALWTSVKSKIGDEEFDKILHLVNYPTAQEDLEELISRLILKRSTAANDGLTKEESQLDGHIKNLQGIIRDDCSFTLDQIKGSQHTMFVQKLLNSRKKTAPRLKIFTLNYDTSFEQAGKKTDTIVIDGFSFTQNEFSGINFDLDIVKRDKSRIHNEENFYSNVLHLYKLHGSIDWETTASGDIVKNPETKNPVLIYPNSQKYEESYAMPFFEMISRLQMELRKQNVCLLIIGYSFGDMHINRIIEEAINSNFNLEVVVVSPSITDQDLPKNKSNSSIQRLYQRVKSGSHNVTLVGDTFSSFAINLPTPQFQQIEGEQQKSGNEDKSI